MSGELRYSPHLLETQIHKPLSTPVLNYLASKRPDRYQSELVVTDRLSNDGKLENVITFFTPLGSFVGRALGLRREIASVSWPFYEKGPILLETQEPKLIDAATLGTLVKNAGIEKKMEELYSYIRSVRL